MKKIQICMDKFQIFEESIETRIKGVINVFRASVYSREEEK